MLGGDIPKRRAKCTTARSSTARSTARPRLTRPRSCTRRGSSFTRCPCCRTSRTDQRTTGTWSWPMHHLCFFDPRNRAQGRGGCLCSEACRRAASSVPWMRGFLWVAWRVWSVEAIASESAAEVAKSTITADIAEYSRELEEYTAALQKYDDEVNGYWTAIADKRRARIAKRRNNEKIQIDDYVLA